MKPESKLLQAARVFAFRTDDKQDDDVIGEIRGVLVYAGEVRRLNDAVAEEDDRRYAEQETMYIRRSAGPYTCEEMSQMGFNSTMLKDPADDGPEVDLIRFFRCYRRGTYNGLVRCRKEGAFCNSNS